MSHILFKEISEKRSIIILIIVFVIAASFLLVYNFFSDQKLDWQLEINTAIPTAYRLLDGQAATAKNSSLRPIAVVIENHIDSRPAAGLQSASIIYETIVEGDITRYLAIFDGDIIANKIGPVRSVRPFFVDLAKDWGAVIFHSGGSPDALAQLKQTKAGQLYDLNEISGDGIYFWRDPQRQPPHNLYTSANLIKRAMTAKEIDLKASFSPYLFKGDQPIANATDLISQINVPFAGNPEYEVNYQYNQSTNDYTRYLAGQIAKTDRGIILTAKNIVVCHVNSKIVDDYGRRSIDLKSGGKAEVYFDGKVIYGHWQRNEGQIRFYSADGKQVRFNRGVIWIELAFN